MGAGSLPPIVSKSLALYLGGKGDRLGGGGGVSESGPLRAVQLSRHKWPGGLANWDSGRLSESN